MSLQEKLLLVLEIVAVIGAVAAIAHFVLLMSLR